MLQPTMHSAQCLMPHNFALVWRQLTRSPRIGPQALTGGPPPFLLVGNVLCKIQQKGARGILILPYWPAAWWPMLVDEQGHFAVGVWDWVELLMPMICFFQVLSCLLWAREPPSGGCLRCCFETNCDLLLKVGSVSDLWLWLSGTTLLDSGDRALLHSGNFAICTHVQIWELCGQV